MDKLNKEHIISINVGGKIYMTTLNLISRYKNSRLYEIVQEKLTNIPDLSNDYKKREIFIDRNGNRFEYILDFLRDGVLICENDIIVLTRILIEAIYFKLFSLMKIIKKKINLLHSNMNNSVNKNVFKQIINTIEKNRKEETNKLVKLSSIISNYSELKYFNLKKKKKKTYINILNNSNIINEINHVNTDTEKGFARHNKNDSTHYQKNESTNKLNLQSITHEKEKKKTNAYKESYYDTNINSEKNMNSQENISNIYTKSESQNLKFSNKIERKVSKDMLNSNLKNDVDKKDNHLSDTNSLEKSEKDAHENSEYYNPKTIGHKYVSFSGEKDIIFYNNSETWSEDDQLGNIKNSKAEKEANSSPKNISRLRNINGINNKVSELNYIGNNDYIRYRDYEEYGCEDEHNNFPNYINSVRNKKSTYNYEYNNMKNNVRNPIMVYPEIDDVEETSNYPIMPNINLGEQIFSTTVDF
ncbi:conserved Plasmodium protein, unknown function [Plasmodium vinckei vinckei]|uniref:Potassium channel tetramerisation-type BTB domain-containing protein n=1 Tax=Plasmodium vinckei vinckei TaxID=54757 RepID=A0A449C0T8_PLAVN|nr:conserved Plasmodium protein, unknown function [Plasmodium vinckei vinckei]VEV59309.1 conserved Plasmodium protein, unknown function [Plasmodium vinckei vinckei]